MISVKLYFDKRKPTKKGTYIIRINIYHGRTNAQITTGIDVFPDEWDEIRSQVIKRKDRNALNLLIENMFTNVRNIVYTAQNEGKLVGMSATQIKNYVLGILDPTKKSAKIGAFKECFDHFIGLHSNQRTQALYRQTWKTIQRFDERADNLNFEDVDRDWLERFFLFMEDKAPSVNARNIHMRNIRAVFNNAIDNEKTTLYPFRRLKIKPVATAKRNITPEYMRQIFEEHEEDANMQKALDMFKLTFLLIGINTIDLCYLREIRNGRIEFNRAKTHRLYSIKVEPEADQIINRYKGKGEYLLNLLDNVKDYKNITKFINTRLQIYTGYLHIDESTHNGKRCQSRRYNNKRIPLTTYYARHSWATIAASLDIPKETIAAALGHGGNSVTDIYIEFDQKKVDAANRRVIDYVLYGKK